MPSKSVLISPFCARASNSNCALDGTAELHVADYYWRCSWCRVAAYPRYFDQPIFIFQLDVTGDAIKVNVLGLRNQAKWNGNIFSMQIAGFNRQIAIELVSSRSVRETYGR